ncbi:MAG: hypothetical protein J5517_05110 [Eubacterium sp.]|nr:hypothetical protein [Eubacterium sp.]
MKYRATYEIASQSIRSEDANVEIGKEGLRLGDIFIDFADLDTLKPINHRVMLTLLDGTGIEISMLGFSYDGFWEELTGCFGERTLQALFVQEETIMKCEGEYSYYPEDHPEKEAGRGQVILVSDAVIILPQSSNAVRVPLFYAESVTIDGYQIMIKMKDGRGYQIGKFGYDTKPFFERCETAFKKTTAKRQKLLDGFTSEKPFTYKGLFRTIQETEFWGAAFGDGKAAIELYTKDDSATYLYSFDDKDRFVQSLEKAMEAVGSHREIIFLSEEELSKKPLYRMAVHRSGAVRFLRSCSAGRLIHSKDHAKKLDEFLNM